MSYKTVDQLQNMLSNTVFDYSKDAKKAAGRALGTIVEIITFYLLRSWGLRDSTAIERRIPEYGNPAILHNVEYSIHPVINKTKATIRETKLPLSSVKIRNHLNESNQSSSGIREAEGGKNSQLLSSSYIVRNSCIIQEGEKIYSVAHLESWDGSNAEVSVSDIYCQPYAILECKRVGIQEGLTKGPQTIEKAKQGAYVAKAVSSLQKMRLSNGEMVGVIEPYGKGLVYKPYPNLMAEILKSEGRDLLHRFILSIGVVSNHGNWFTSDDHNKELKVLAQSYDWLIFLSDVGLSNFITELLLEPNKEFQPVRDAFLKSYTGRRNKNRFTKVQMDYDADAALIRYFSNNRKKIEAWFNIISPKGRKLSNLKKDLNGLRRKDWADVHQLEDLSL